MPSMRCVARDRAHAVRTKLKTMMVVENKLDKIRNAKKKFEGLKKSLSQQIIQDEEEESGMASKLPSRLVQPSK